MNNIHDMGGMQGFGTIPLEVDEPVFHTRWEARAMAITVAMAAWGRWNVDASRHAREKLPPADYLQFTYYERWIAALTNLMVECDLVGLGELESGRAEGRKSTPPLKVADVAGVLARGGPVDRDVPDPPAFAAGAPVHVPMIHPEGHTRLPRYVRGRSGEVVRHHGAHVFPDSNAHGHGEAPQHLYSVRFRARDLWGADRPAGDTVTLDLWESYLEVADGR